MVDLLKPLGLAALLALATPAFAQETGADTAPDATGAAPQASDAAPAEAADTEAEAAPAESEAAPAEGDATPAAEPATEQAAAGSKPEAYIDEVFTDWSRECVRRPEGSEGADPCWISQVLKDDNGRPFGKFSVRRVPAGSPAIAQADVAVSMELVPYLPAGVKLGVDKGLAKEFNYLFCTPGTGCMVQPNLSAEDIEAFKAGDVLNMSFAIVTQATELATITSPVSLKGFTAAFDSVPGPSAPAQ